MLHKNDSVVSIDSTHTIPPYVPPSSSPSKGVKLGIFASRKVALTDMKNDMAWVQEFINGNAGFVKHNQIDRFRNVVAEHKKQMEGASGRSFFSDYLNRSGQVKTRLLYKDLQYLMEQLKDMATEVVLRGAKQKVEKRHGKTRVDTIDEHAKAPGSSNASSVETEHTVSKGSSVTPEWQFVKGGPECDVPMNPDLTVTLSDVDIAGVLSRAREVSK
ncbi:hypothetical protein FRB96_002747 [Tulasnella sp. 330]|nr:hypothetical protein FRB96_002747 [Tulasnella sp. 330]KAG8870527.1 hypothetical protein FRB97_009682 [Tulasnella sp. 331]KAG8872874.1 hypothetical protein FRB98_009314 [Tulasnella sp. 332]